MKIVTIPEGTFRVSPSMEAALRLIASGAAGMRILYPTRMKLLRDGYVLPKVGAPGVFTLTTVGRRVLEELDKK